MNDKQEQVKPSAGTPQEPQFNTDELNQLAKFLDALMEAELSLDERIVSNAC